MIDSAQLTDFELFSELTSDQRDEIAQLCSPGEFARGEEVFRQGASATHFYGLLEGEVELVLVVTSKVLKTRIDYEEALTVEHEILERPIVVETLGPGEVFGWMSLIRPPGQRTVTARCLSPCRIFSIPAVDLLAMCDRDPRVGYLVMGQLVGLVSQRLQHRTEKMTEAWSEAFDSHRI